MVTTDLVKKFRLVTNDYSNNISGMITCDMLSVALSQGAKDNVLITVQNNCNSVAVAKLISFSCIILCSGFKASLEMIEKANENSVVIFESNMSAVDIVLLLNDLGVRNE